MISKNQLKFLKSLQIKKFRKEHQAFLLEGEKIVVEAMEMHFQMTELFCTDQFAQKHSQLISQTALSITLASSQELSQAGTLVTNSTCLAVAPTPSPSIITIQTNEYALVLDGIQDPGNFGTICRIADWYGVHKIICSEDTVDLFNPKTISATMGSFLRVQVMYANLEKYFESHLSVPRYGAVLDGQNVHHTSFTPSGLIVLGNESKGIRPEIRKLLTHQISIPRFGNAESLNVGIATAVICDNLRRVVG